MIFSSITDFKEVEELMNTKGGRDFGVTLKFLGANNGIVTGSATLVTIRQGNVIRSILVDYGSFQGIDEEYNDCREIDPSQIDAVVLTHPHLDHCGGLPKLFVDEGIIYEFKGKIYGSYESLREAIHILRDSAKVNDIKSHGTKGTLRRAKKSLKLQREKAIREDCSSKDIAQIDSDYSQISLFGGKLKSTNFYFLIILHLLR